MGGEFLRVVQTALNELPLMGFGLQFFLGPDSLKHWTAINRRHGELLILPAHPSLTRHAAIGV
jgi:hypothetical protein